MELHRQTKLLGIIIVRLYMAGKQRIMYSVFIKYLRKKWEYSEALRQMFTKFVKVCDYITRNVLYIILIDFGIPTKLV